MTKAINDENRTIWDANAATWDEAMNQTGNSWHKELIAPKTVEYMDIRAGDEVLDVGCGNGIFARRLRDIGAKVTAFDFSEKNIENAMKYDSEGIDYSVLDATDYDVLLGLGKSRFRSAAANMVLMDIPTIEPLFRAMSELLNDEGTFVFSIQHPCFNSNETEVVQSEKGEAVQLFNYIEEATGKGDAIEGQPLKQFYFHRPISTYTELAFRNGFVVDGFHEPVFESDDLFGRIPPVLIIRLRKS